MSKQTAVSRLWAKVSGKQKPVVRRQSSCSGGQGPGYESLEVRQLMAGDMVLQWNEQLLDAIRVARPAPPVAARAMAIVHTAVFDAVNSIGNCFVSYAATIPVHPKASQEAAVAAAAERTLSSLFPSLQQTFSAALVSSLAAVPDGIREDQGVEVGRMAADRILALRSNDGSTATVNYQPGNLPGDWRPTPSGFAAAVLPQWADLTPFAMASSDQFLAPPPPALTSEQYATDYNMVKSLGSINSTVRTAAQSQVAQIWAGGPGTATPPGQWNMIAQDLAVSQGNDLYENARMFALLNIALADAAISCWNTKYEYDLWRPITAIREGATDGNAATEADAQWTPLLNTPAFPAYSSGHSTFSGAGSTVLAGFFGTDNLAFTLDSEVAGVQDRSYTSLRAAADEAGFSRIFGGIHFNFDNFSGKTAGRQIGQLVLESQLGTQTNVLAGRNGHELVVAGTHGDDRIFITRSGSEIVVRNHGQLVGRFGMAGMWTIVVNGSDGNDRIELTGDVRQAAEVFGGAGSDRVFGGNGRNWIYGEAGNDDLFGGIQNDVLRGGDGDDSLYGLSGNDLLDGEAGWNWLYGGAGDDTLYGKRNRDRLFGGGGNNQLLWS